MTGLAINRVSFKIIFMIAVPAGVINIVQTVGAIGGEGQARAMADGAFDDGAGMTLDLLCCDVVVGAGAHRPFGVGTAVAGLAGDAVVSQAIVIQRIVVFGKPLIGGNPGSGGGITGIVGSA